MKQLVLTVNDAVCLANGKDVNATQLIEVMKTYGTVEDYNEHIAGVKKVYQEALDNVVAQNEAIKAQNLSEDEIAIVNTYRTQRAIAVKVHVDEKEELRQTLHNVKAEHEKTIEIITNAINKK